MARDQVTTNQVQVKCGMPMNTFWIAGGLTGFIACDACLLKMPTVFIIALQAAADNLRGIRIFPSRLSFGCRQTLKVNTKLLQSLPSCIGPPGNREKFVENSDRHDGKRQHHKI